MKRRDLVSSIRRACAARGVAFGLERSGGRHDLDRVGTVLVPVPRHGELGEGLVRAIRRQCEAVLGEAWWR